MPAFTFHVWQVPGLNEVILIGVYEDSIFQTFLKDCKREFPNISVSCVYSFSQPSRAALEVEVVQRESIVVVSGCRRL